MNSEEETNSRSTPDIRVAPATANKIAADFSSYSSRSILAKLSLLVGRNWQFGLRLMFGLIWLAAAILKWILIAGGINLSDLITMNINGQPTLIASWISFWTGLLAQFPGFSYAMAATETIIAVTILIGFSTKLTSLLGIIFSLMIWTTAEGFGGIFTGGTSDIGPSPVYMVVFAALIAVRAGRYHGVDGWLARKFSIWRRLG